MVTLVTLRAHGVTVAGVTLDPGVAPVVLLAAVAAATSEAGFAGALAGVEVAGLGGRANGIAVTILAALAAREFPMVLLAPEKNRNRLGQSGDGKCQHHVR